MSTVSIVTVADSISKITWSSSASFSVKDLDGIIDEIVARQCPLVMPAPDWLSGIEIEMDNLGSGTAAQWTFTYMVSYRMFYSPLGQGKNQLASVMPGLAQEVVYFLEGIIDNDNLDGCEHIELAGSPTFGVVEDPAGNAFWGADIDLVVTELV